MQRHLFITREFFYVAFYLAALGAATGLLQFLSPALSYADNNIAPRVSDLAVANTKRYLLAYFSLKNGLTYEIAAAIQSGIPIKYTYEIELNEPRLLIDKTLFHGYISRTLSYDALRGEYTITLGPKNPRAVSVKSRAEALSMMFEINGTPLVPVSRLRRGVTYRLSVRAAAEKVESNIQFPGLMNIFSPWDLKTDWNEIYFTY
ncbi:DUF4390 domain-containing protein [Dissulfurimicrobium hydrothermale]|uniref:DUF4390 domain-containing protein n=1 Tax=Dissulfurimicrobium hydrothermale TaxID=1750598 RepID=UPI001EDC0EC0|nr:DUF4390 domain-containing protein [Dissulfurimicrobium hydrothermale]UKL13787.1 DUF4390 domain-containing protein [Dissulfurimicrobium hydrothermale]